MICAGINRGKVKSTEKGVDWALWLYGFMVLSGRLKYIFILPKLRLIQIIQKKKKQIVQINFAEKKYLFSTASGNSLRNSYKAFAGGGNLAPLCRLICILRWLPQVVIFRFAKKVGGKNIINL